MIKYRRQIEIQLTDILFDTDIAGDGKRCHDKLIHFGLNNKLLRNEGLTKNGIFNDGKETLQLVKDFENDASIT